MTEDPPLKYLIPLGVALLAVWLVSVGMVDSACQGNGSLGGISEIQIIEGSYLLPQAPPFIYHGKVLAILTAYTPRPEETDDTPYITASGELVREGIVACPIYLPFGTLIEIDGEIYECQDRMNPRFWYQNRFDILMFDLEKAREFGKKVVEVKIIK